MALVAENGVDISDTNFGGHSATGILHHQDLQIRGICCVEQMMQMKYTSNTGEGGDD